LAIDGQECVEKVFSHDPGFYSLILVSLASLSTALPRLRALYHLLSLSSIANESQCDLQMPRKDGYETCRDIRKWEKTNHLPRMPMLALSANVVDESGPQCTAAGFDNFVTKPVTFKDLSAAIGDLLEPIDKSAATMKGATAAGTSAKGKHVPKV
jgi:CheY-like chemotaxis protein